MGNCENENPPVSIIVITYNSSRYVLETLESAKAQTYKNIELIVSDDCSTDNTVAICNTWIEKNKSRFVRTKLVTVEKNTGIAPNCNRGLHLAKGAWVKFIAGDDILFENCILEFVMAVKNNYLIQIIFSDLATNGNSSINNQPLESFSLLTADEQYKQLLKKNILSAPASFIKHETAIKLNGFDEAYPMFEDYPFYLKALKNNIKIFYINSKLVYYRINKNSLTSSDVINIKYYKSIRQFFLQEYLKSLWKERLYQYLLHYLIELLLLNLVVIHIIKRENIYRIILKWLSILSWTNKIKKIIF